jgi:hypothetical protein
VLAPSIELVRLMGIDAIVKTRQTQALLKKKEPNFQDDAPGKERGPNKSDRTHLLLYYLPVSAVLTRNQQHLRRSGSQETLSTETSQKRTAAL